MPNRQAIFSWIGSHRDRFAQGSNWVKGFYIGLVLVALYVFAGLAPFILGGVFSYLGWTWIDRKEFSGKTPIVLRSLIVVIALGSLSFGSAWAGAYFSGSSSRTAEREGVPSVENRAIVPEQNESVERDQEQSTASGVSVNYDIPEEVDDVETNLPEAESALQTAEAERQTYFAVTQIVDGDTIKLDTIGTVRLIGVDTPETKHPSKPVQCFGVEASEYLKSLIEGKRVAVEFDDSQGQVDRYGRVLAYVRGEDGVFVSEEMIRQGYAHEYTYSTPYKYQAEFKAAEAEAREANRGLWNPETCAGDTEQAAGEEVVEEAPVVTETAPPVVKPKPAPVVETETVTPPQEQAAAPAAEPEPIAPSKYTCDCSKACTKITSCEEAYFQLNECGCSRRDGDGDGVPCESLCR